MRKPELHPPDHPHRIIVTVVSQKGSCAAGHGVGDKIVYDGLNLEGYLCPSAFAVLYRYMYAMRFGAKFTFGNIERSSIRIACPDADNPVVFELMMQNV